jgi:Zn-dependent protease with chaperone function
MSTLLIIFLLIFVLGPIAKAYADRISRELPPGSDINAAELARLKEEVERLTADLARLQEEQSFMVQVLTEGDRKRLGEGSGSARSPRHDPHPPIGEPNGDT